MTLPLQTLVNIRFSGQADPLSSCELAGQGRVLLRKSGTEPLLRVMVEGRCAETIERCAQQIADVVRVTTLENTATTTC